MHSKLITIKELSENIRIKIGTLYNWVSKREIPFVKIKGRLFFKIDEIDKWIEYNSFAPHDVNTNEMAEKILAEIKELN